MSGHNPGTRLISLLIFGVSSALIAGASAAASAAQTSDDVGQLIISSVTVDDQTTIIDARLSYISLADGTEIALTGTGLPTDAVMSFPALSPDGQSLAVTVSASDMFTDHASPTSAYLMDSSGDHARKIPGGDYGAGTFWSLDGRYLAFATASPQADGSPSGMYYYDTTDELTHLIIATDLTDAMIGWMPDNQHILYGGLRDDEGQAFDTVYQVKIDGTEAEQVKNFRNVSAMRWSPDGTQLAVCRSLNSTSQPPAIVLLKSLDDTPLKLYTFPSQQQCFLTALAWSPDGTEIAFETLKANGIDINIVTVATGEMRKFRPGERLEFFFGLDWGRPALLPVAATPDPDAVPTSVGKRRP